MSEPRLSPALQQVPLYVAGRSVEEVRAELGLDEVIKLASNESPIGPSPLAMEAARQALAEAHRYPGVADHELRAKIASQLGHGLSEANLVTGNGGTDILRMIVQAFVFDGGNAIMSQVTFPMYRILAGGAGGEARIVPPQPDLSHDLEAMVERVDDDTRLIFLCTPNNPTGHIFDQATADWLMARLPDHVVAVFDESYCAYVADGLYADSLGYVASSRPVLVVRSFSKSAGLANLRVGYAIGPMGLMSYLQRTRLPFHVGDIALLAAAASMDDYAYQDAHQLAVRRGRDYLVSAMGALGLDCRSGEANFVLLVDPPGGATFVVEALLRQGIIVRGMAGFGLPNAIRITVGNQAANERLIAALRRVVQPAVPVVEPV
jgi:histidinol-phosphate aminotransferase